MQRQVAIDHLRGAEACDIFKTFFAGPASFVNLASNRGRCGLDIIRLNICSRVATNFGHRGAV